MTSARYDDQGRRLCAGHTKAGNLCRAPAVHGATVCRLHGAAKGSPGRIAADNLILSELVGPALWRLKGLIDSKETTGPVLLGAIKEVLDRTGYRELHKMSVDEIDHHIDMAITYELEKMEPDDRDAWLTANPRP